MGFWFAESDVNRQESAKHQMDFAMALGFAKGICSGMAHLHSEGVLHCDLRARLLNEFFLT